MKRGQKVRLTKTGLRRIFGTSKGLEDMLSKEYVLTFVGKKSLASDRVVKQVSVDCPELNTFILTTDCFREIA